VHSVDSSDASLRHCLARCHARVETGTIVTSVGDMRSKLDGVSGLVKGFHAVAVVEVEIAADKKVLRR